MLYISIKLVYLKMMKVYTDKDLKETLAQKIKEFGNQNQLAKAWGFSRAYIADLVAGKRNIGAVANQLGFIELVRNPPPKVYQKLKEQTK